MHGTPERGGVGGFRRYAYVAASDMNIINISDPQNPSLVSNYVSPENALDVAVAGDFAYVADGGRGLRVLDISNPAEPTERGFYDTPVNSEGVALLGDYVCIADDEYGVYIVEFYGAGVAEETMNGERGAVNAGPSIVRGVLRLPPLLFPHSSLLSVDGRNMLGLRPGANDVRCLAPGVYFVRPASGAAKVIVTR